MTAAVEIAPIDAQTAYDLLAAAVELAGPDHIYEIPDGRAGCQYVDGDNPSCIVGVSLAIHGVPLDVMREWDAGTSTAIDCVDAGFIDGAALNIFSAAQSVQDRVGRIDHRPAEVTWGKALESAAAALANLR